MDTPTGGIGEFAIGESGIGVSTVAFDWVNTVYAQYANSPIFMALLQSFSNWFDQSANIDGFYDNVWNIDTAQGYGLDVWGRIVGIGRVLAQPAIGQYFGFEQNLPGVGTFGQYPFYSGTGATSNYSLSDPAYRQLILAKAAANIWDGSIQGLNSILRILFPGQVVYVADGLNMTMQYTFEFTLTATDIAIINSGVLPRPAGVYATYVQT